MRQYERVKAREIKIQSEKEGECDIVREIECERGKGCESVSEC